MHSFCTDDLARQNPIRRDEVTDISAVGMGRAQTGGGRVREAARRV